MKFVVEGMTCGHCVKTITSAIQALDGNAQVNVDLAAKTVAITGQVTQDAAKQAIGEAGYAVTGTADESADSEGGEAKSCCGGCR